MSAYPPEIALVLDRRVLRKNTRAEHWISIALTTDQELIAIDSWGDPAVSHHRVIESADTPVAITRAANDLIGVKLAGNWQAQDTGSPYFNIAEVRADLESAAGLTPGTRDLLARPDTQGVLPTVHDTLSLPMPEPDAPGHGEDIGTTLFS